MRVAALLLFSFISLGARSDPVSFSPPDGETLRNMLLSDSGLVLGSSHALRRLSPDLQVQQSTDLPGGQPNRLLVGDPGGTYSGSVMACHGTDCELLDISNLSQQRWQASGVLLDGSFNAHGLFVIGPNGSSVFTAALRNEIRVSRILRGNLVNVDREGGQHFSRYAAQDERTRFDPREFLAAFEHVGFSFLVNRLEVTGGDQIRVVRLCNNDSSSVISPGTFASYFEIQLTCSSSQQSVLSLPTAATHIRSPNPFGTDVLLVSATSETGQNLMCAYNISTIQQLMTEKFQTCSSGTGLAGLERESQHPCPNLTPEQIINSNAGECNLVGDLLPAQVVDGALNSAPIISESMVHSFSSLLHTTLDGFHFIFAGTTRGELLQYYVESSMSFHLIHNFTLVSSANAGVNVTNITQLAASSDGLTLYALTPKKLIQHSVDVCDSYLSCDECLGSGDPVCGWCALESRCSRRVNCAESTEWVREDTGLCPVISSTDPSIVYTYQLQNGLTTELQTSNIPAGGRAYSCVHVPQNVGSQMTFETMATRNGDTFTCAVPTDIPPIPEGQDAVLSRFSLRHNGVDVATFATLFRFADCSVHASCTPCISTASGCGWCPFTFQCIPQPDQCGGSEASVSESCPKILSHDVTGNYLLHTNFRYEENPLIIQANNLDEFSSEFDQGQFKCVMCEGGRCVEEGSRELFRLDAVLAGGGSEVHCQQRKFAYTNGLARLEVALDVLWTQNNLTIDNPDNAAVTLYSCSGLGTNCAQCLSLSSDYQCSYCEVQGIPSCSLNSLCSGTPISDVENCNLPVITSFSPTAGPIAGGTLVTVEGTNLGVSTSHIELVRINGVECDVIDELYRPGVSFTCETSQQTSVDGSYPIHVKFSFLDDEIVSQEKFKFVIPGLSTPPASPSQGPVSGGTVVTISGTHLDVGSTHSVTLAQVNCEIMNISSSTITCLSSPGALNMGQFVTVQIDNWEMTGNSFVYVTDPTFTTIEPRISFAAGGTLYTVTGTNLNVIQKPRLLFYFVNVGAGSRRKRDSVAREPDVKSEPCISNADGLTMTCMAPPITLSSTHQQASIGLEMDGVTELLVLNESVAVHPNPRFKTFNDLSFSNNEDIELTIESEGGEFIFTADMVKVLITPCSIDECACIDIIFDSTNTSLSCEVESVGGLPTGEDLTVTVHVGAHSQNVGQLMVTDSQDFITTLIPVVVTVGVLFIIGTVVFVIVVTVFCHRTRQKDHRYNQLMMEMERLESSVARECKLGFAELQTDLDELTGDVAGHRLPYYNLQVYLLASLFPGSKDHPVLHDVQLPVQRKISTQRALKDFHDLCLDKKVLLIFIRSMEEQRSFSIRDKSLVGSLLMVALHTRLDYATEILKSLLTDVIHRAISRSHPKLLLRRTESVAERMLTNWLAFCLHGYIVEHAGKPLYLLYRAVKSQLEKGPTDVITGEARYSLSEHKLIRQKMDVEVINVTVEADDGLRMPVKLLDCDTVSQAKEKLLDAIYKATPVSQRPSLTSVDLEYLKSPREYMVLRDEDSTTETEGYWKRINTLSHYRVEEGAAFRLMKRRSHAPPGRSFDYPASLISSHSVRNRALSEAEDGMRVWHLFKQPDVEDPRRSPFLNKKMITEVYLPRMLSTKNILQKFVDDLFNTLFSVSQTPASPSAAYVQLFPHSPGTQAPMGYAPGTHTVPMAVKYILDFLDDEAESAQISDADVVHTWKNNALALRFWVSMIKNPEFIFDINKSHTVDACLSVIAQAFIDGCSFADVKLTIDSPTSKLLYNKEVQGYKVRVKQYYDNVARLPRVPEDAMQYYLKQLSGYQAQLFRKSGGFVVESALYELLRYGIRYHEQFLSNLRAAGLESRAQVFESVLRATM